MAMENQEAGGGEGKNRRTFWEIAGWVFLVAGIVSLVLPFLHGFVLIVIGVFILAHYSPRFARIKEKIESYFVKPPGR